MRGRPLGDHGRPARRPPLSAREGFGLTAARPACRPCITFVIHSAPSAAAAARPPSRGPWLPTAAAARPPGAPICLGGQGPSLAPRLCRRAPRRACAARRPPVFGASAAGPWPTADPTAAHLPARGRALCLTPRLAAGCRARSGAGPTAALGLGLNDLRPACGRLGFRACGRLSASDESVGPSHDDVLHVYYDLCD